jgi:magnesium chelatase family protein
MLAAELAGLLPALSAAEALRVTMLHSVAGRLVDGGLIQGRSFVSRIIWGQWWRLLAVGHEPVRGKFRWRIMVCCFWMN